MFNALSMLPCLGSAGLLAILLLGSAALWRPFGGDARPRLWGWRPFIIRPRGWRQPWGWRGRRW
jgi:hypothetical protein